MIKAEKTRWIFFIFLFQVLNTNAQDKLAQNNISVSAFITQYDTSHYNKVVCRNNIALANNETIVDVNGSKWLIKKLINQNNNQFSDVKLVFKCISGKLNQSSVSLNFNINNWMVKNYVLMPAAVYNGNRVKAIIHPYLAFLTDSRDIGVDSAQIISDVPRLNIGKGPSRIQQRSGDMSTPSVGFFNPDTHKAFWMLTNQAYLYNDNGIDFEENAARNQASLTITNPVVRENTKYIISNTSAPSTDKPANYKIGDSVVLQTKVYLFDADNVQGLYDKFAVIRNDFLPKGKPNYSIPFSAAFEIQEEKFNRQNFEPTFVYYSLGMRESASQDWQIGWTGGMISPYPLLLLGSQQTKKNVVSNFNWLFPNGISPSGYFWDTGEKGNKWMGIFSSIATAKDLHLVRKSGDGLFYVIKELEAFKKFNILIEPSWEAGTKTVANTFINTWEKYGQLGQYVHNTTGEIVIGGSASGAIVPGALALASSYFNNPSYLDKAKEMGDYFNNQFVSKGLIYGAAGDAVQNFDSEATYALLESYMTLYEKTGDKKWLSIAENVAIQFSTWISSYDFNFPKNSTLYKLHKTTTGAVWANTQNKHGAPGICTHSGVALLRLYRATGNKFYADLLQNITQAIPQYLATDKNPIPALQNGWVSERVSTTDWLEGIGEIFPGSTWSETSLMLTIAEIPSVYVNTDNGTIIPFDQVKAIILKKSIKSYLIQLENPTTYNCKLKVLVENNDTIKSNYANLSSSNYVYVTLKPGEKKNLTIKK